MGTSKSKSTSTGTRTLNSHWSIVLRSSQYNCARTATSMHATVGLEASHFLPLFACLTHLFASFSLFRLRLKHLT
jgi:hypothetical protein